MRRREFVTLLGGAALASPFAAHAQQHLPVVGFLNSGAPTPYGAQVKAFLAGLAEQGFVEGRNVAIDFRWAENQLDQLPAMAAELVAKNVAVIVSSGGELPLLAARSASKTIPIVATMGGDPVIVLSATTAAEIESALMELDRTKADTLIIQADPFFVNQRTQLADLALKHRIAAIHEARAFVAAGGLVSYGADLLEVYRLTGQTTGKVLKGTKPAEIPVQQSVTFAMALNLKTAKALGLAVPALVIAQVDEVIE